MDITALFETGGSSGTSKNLTGRVLRNMQGQITVSQLLRNRAAISI